MKKNNIDEFYFNMASYLIKDKFGNSFFLNIDYKSKSFEVIEAKVVEGSIKNLKKEVFEIAKGLLKRKSGVNFVKRFR